MSVSKRPFPTSQSHYRNQISLAKECIKEAVPDQPEPAARRGRLPSRVYQRGRSRPARATVINEAEDKESVSKRPFPTSQSEESHGLVAPGECIKEAVPDQPEPASSSCLVIM